jgi:hypothetical protein
MKAAVYEKPETFAIKEVPYITCRQDDVIIEVVIRPSE